MAPARRKKYGGGRAKAAPKGAKMDATVENGEPVVGELEVQEEPSDAEAPDTCPVCESTPLPAGEQDRNWVACESCETWYHASCIGLAGKLDTVDKWYCTECITKDPSRTITFKAPARKSSRAHNKVDYANLNAGIAGDPRRWFRHLSQKPMKKDNFKRMKGSEVTLEWLQSDESAMTEPIVIPSPDGLGMKMPSSTFTVKDVVRLVGPNEKVEVLDVASQREDKGWTLQTWGEYYDKPASEREKIRNVISLEISETKLAEKITPPSIVRDIDWVEQAWPAAKRKGSTYPKVQMYCLMSVAECWTDWHLDFAGSSVYYHILKGSKIFYFIRPTPANLAAYEKWSGSDTNQSSVWLGDWVDEVIKVELTAGNTMIIPTGWIHCVYTPKDSLVFGGNFLHSWNIPTQLRVRALEISTKVPKKFRFPYFRKLCWYVAEKTLKDLKAKAELPARVMNGMDALARFLVKESRILERSSSTETARRDTKDQIPGTIKDPTALARELRWRVRLAAGHDSDDELESPFTSSKEKSNGSANGKASASGTPAAATNPLKRKRGAGADRAASTSSDPNGAPRPRFKGFIPRDWDQVELKAVEADVVDEVSVTSLPAHDAGLEWFETAVASTSTATDHPMNGESGSVRAKRARTTDEIVKLRRTVRNEDGTVARLERETIRRVYESWEFDGAQAKDEDAEVDVVQVEDDPKAVDGSASFLDGATSAAYDFKIPSGPLVLPHVEEPDMDAKWEPPVAAPVTNPPLATTSASGFTPGLPSKSINDMLVDTAYTDTWSPSLTA